MSFVSCESRILLLLRPAIYKIVLPASLYSTLDGLFFSLYSRVPVLYVYDTLSFLCCCCCCPATLIIVNRAVTSAGLLCCRVRRLYYAGSNKSARKERKDVKKRGEGLNLKKRDYSLNRFFASLNLLDGMN